MLPKKSNMVSAPVAAFAILASLSSAAFAATATNATPAVVAAAPVAAVPERSGKSADVDALTLIGTASSPAGDCAFFDSNRAEFRLLVHPGERIGNLLVESITADHVQLKDGSREVSLQVTEQIQRSQPGRWELVTGTARLQWQDASPAPAPASESKVIAMTQPTVPAGKSVAPIASPAPSDKQLRMLDKVVMDSVKPPKDLKKLDLPPDGKLIKKIAKEFKRSK